LEQEETIKKELEGKFTSLVGKILIKRERRIFIDIPKEIMKEFFQFAYDRLQCVILCTISGLDEGENLGIIYHLGREDGIVVNVKVSVPKTDPKIESVSSLFSGAVLYERELVDMFGIKVEGLPPGKRYPLPDNWPEGMFPLRKDWKPSMLKERHSTTNE